MFIKNIINKVNYIGGDAVDDRYRTFHQGCNYKSYEFMGAHFCEEDNIRGARFTTWAPNAQEVYIVGDFSEFKVDDNFKMIKKTEGGIWSIFIPNIKANIKYKYAFKNNYTNKYIYKADPYAVKSEIRPRTASILIEDSKYIWNDSKWIKRRNKKNIYESPINIYEIHLGSWKRDGDEFLSYEKLAFELPKYIYEMGYTHVEFMPLLEHPLDESWGYQGTGYYSITSRYGDRDGFKLLVDSLHRIGIGVILDWVPGHFCKDEYGLYMYDGGISYEYREFWKANNSGWGTFNFDLGRPEVRSFLISNALYWLREFHIDGLRVDAVSNILYLSYGRKEGEWKKNIHGTNICLEGESFLKELNNAIDLEFNNLIIAAEESTAYPKVTHSVIEGGLGFKFKWDMGWMNDTLEYIGLSPDERKNNHNKLTFPMIYNSTEKFILPISHDEVVHGKKSMIEKIRGDYWTKFAGLRLYELFKISHPGKILTFMGTEFAQFIEWRSYESLEWKLIDEFNMHKMTHKYFKDINRLYKGNSALWINDFKKEGFEWIDPDNKEQSILIYIRRGIGKYDSLIFILNFNNIVHYDFRIGVPYRGRYREVFNSDSLKYGGSGQVIKERLFSENIPFHNQQQSLVLKVPPMGGTVLRLINEKRYRKGEN